MTPETIVNHVRSQSTGIPGRCIATARTNHVVIDAPAFHGGPNEAMVPAEAFLAGIASCGVLLVEHFATEESLALTHVAASIEGIRSRSDPANFREVLLEIEIAGTDLSRAESLVEKFKAR